MTKIRVTWLHGVPVTKPSPLVSARKFLNKTMSDLFESLLNGAFCMKSWPASLCSHFCFQGRDFLCRLNNIIVVDPPFRRQRRINLIQLKLLNAFIQMRTLESVDERRATSNKAPGNTNIPLHLTLFLNISAHTLSLGNIKFGQVIHPLFSQTFLVSILRLPC